MTTVAPHDARVATRELEKAAVDVVDLERIHVADHDECVHGTRDGTQRATGMREELVVSQTASLPRDVVFGLVPGLHGTQDNDVCKNSAVIHTAMN